MEAESHRVLQFRCAEKGRRFIVVFTKQPPSNRFRVTNVVDEQEVTGQDEPQSSIKLLEGSVQRMLVPISAVVAEAAKLIQNFLPASQNTRTIQSAKSAPIVKTTPKSPNPTGSTGASGSRTQPPPSSKRQPAENYDLSEFDFTGFYCPCCGHGKTAVQHRFIRCSRCHELVCGARVKQTPDGRLAFACYDRCGNRGFISGGAMTSISGMGFDTQKSALLENKTKALPGKNQSTLSPGRKKDN